MPGRGSGLLIKLKTPKRRVEGHLLEEKVGEEEGEREREGEGERVRVRVRVRRGGRVTLQLGSPLEQLLAAPLQSLPELRSGCWIPSQLAAVLPGQWYLESIQPERESVRVALQLGCPLERLLVAPLQALSEL